LEWQVLEQLDSLLKVIWALLIPPQIFHHLQNFHCCLASSLMTFCLYSFSLVCHYMFSLLLQPISSLFDYLHHHFFHFFCLSHLTSQQQHYQQLSLFHHLILVLPMIIILLLYRQQRPLPTAHGATLRSKAHQTQSSWHLNHAFQLSHLSYMIHQRCDLCNDCDI